MMDLYEFRCRAMVDRTVMNSPYMDYVSEIKDPDLTSRICIQIPSFCDPELLPTIESFYKNAANPERIVFAVCLQSDDTDTLEVLESMPYVKVMHFSKDHAPGLCAARYWCNRMVSDEEFVMHTDSHMRAARYWDTAVIDMWRACRDSMAVLSGYPADYAPYAGCDPCDDIFTENVRGDSVSVGILSNFDASGIPRFRGLRVRGRSENKRGMFISGGFVFALSKLDRECMSDPDMFFTADEIAMDIRYFTHGYNIYHPAYMPVWHLYGRRNDTADKPVARFNTKDTGYNDRRRREELRLRSLFGLLKDPVSLDGFGYGSRRPFSEFLEASGLDFEHHAAYGFSKTGRFFADLHDMDDKDLMLYYYGPPNCGTGADAHVCRGFDRCTEHGTICVQIPSYRDSQIIRTVESLLYQADRPELVHICIFLQDNDADIIQKLSRIPQVKLKHCDPADAGGTGMARHACRMMYDGEDYVLITDSHMLAIRHWDSMLVTQLHALDDDMAVISGQAPDFGICRGKEFWQGVFDVPYPVGCFGIDSFTKDMGSVPSLLYNNHYMQILKDKWNGSDEFDTCVRSFGITGGYTFAYGKFNDMVPCPESAVYRGDECMPSVIAYTKGFHVYTYRNGYLLHDAVSKRPALPVSGEAYRKEQEAMYELVVTGKTDGAFIGDVYTIDDLTDYLGVDFRKRIVYKRAYTCEPGYFHDDTESIGCHMLRHDAMKRRCTKIHVIAVFSEKTGYRELKDVRDQYEAFRKNMYGSACVPDRIKVHPVYVCDGKTYGYHVNNLMQTLCPDDRDIVLFLDGAVRFIHGWDDALAGTFRCLGSSMVWSVNTYANKKDASYRNPKIQVDYDFNKPSVSVKTLPTPGTGGIKPVMLRGIVAMKCSIYRNVPFDPDLCYAEHIDTYAARLYTHGFDIFYDEMSYLYRTHLIYDLDDMKARNPDTVSGLLGSMYEDFDGDWINRAYGHGTERSLICYYRQFGFIDTNRHSYGSAVL